MTSSKIRSAPWACVISRSPSRKPGSGATTPMLPATGSTITPAISSPRARKRAPNPPPAPAAPPDPPAHRLRRVPRDERPPRAEKVQVRAAVHVPDACALAPRDEERLAADTLEGAHGAVHAAGDEPRRRLEQPLRIPHVACLPELGSDTARSTGRKSPRAASQRKAATESTRPRITDVTR